MQEKSGCSKTNIGLSKISLLSWIAAKHCYCKTGFSFTFVEQAVSPFSSMQHLPRNGGGILPAQLLLPRELSFNFLLFH